MISRADIYAQLSEFFKEPTEEFADDVASGRLLNFFNEVFSILGLDASLLTGLSISGNVYTLLKDEYRKLFIGPIPPYIVPVESVYKRWSDDPGCKLAIAGEKGYLMGDPAIDMIKRYQANGIVIPDKYSSMPDHIALELEYMSYLCNNASKREQREFLETHLDWIDSLSEDINMVDKGGFYSTAIQITEKMGRFYFLDSEDKR
ncbi:MAG: molecular chaperone TorD family protein [Nitrospirota bacterium]